MKAVLLAVNPEWCKLIVNGDKTVEVRKTKPKLRPPFKVYIYCTKHHNIKDLLELHREDGKILPINQKVIGEFECDRISMNIVGYKDNVEGYHYLINGTCLTQEELMNYGAWKILYGWHISNLKVYDNPKELGEFYFPQDRYCEKERCGGCPYDEVMGLDGDYSNDCEWKRPLRRSPQNWCYVEQL